MYIPFSADKLGNNPQQRLCRREFFQPSGDTQTPGLYDSNWGLISVITQNDNVHQTQSAVRRQAEAQGVRVSPAGPPAGAVGPPGQGRGAAGGSRQRRHPSRQMSPAG